MWSTSRTHSTPRSSPRRTVSAPKRAGSPTLARAATSPRKGTPCAAHSHRPRHEHSGNAPQSSNRSGAAAALCAHHASSCEHGASTAPADAPTLVTAKAVSECVHTRQRASFFDGVVRSAVASAHSDAAVALRGEVVALRLRNAALKEENGRLRDAVAEAAIERRRSAAVVSDAATSASHGRRDGVVESNSLQSPLTPREISHPSAFSDTHHALAQMHATFVGAEGLMALIRDAIAAAAEVCLAAGADPVDVDACVNGPVRTMDQQAASPPMRLDKSSLDALRSACASGLHAIRVVLSTVALPQLKRSEARQASVAAQKQQQERSAEDKAALAQWQQRAIRAEREVELLRALQLSAITQGSARSVRQRLQRERSPAFTSVETPAPSAPPTTKRRLASVDIDDDAL